MRCTTLEISEKKKKKLLENKQLYIEYMFQSTREKKAI